MDLCRQTTVVFCFAVKSTVIENWNFSTVFVSPEINQLKYTFIAQLLHISPVAHFMTLEISSTLLNEHGEIVLFSPSFWRFRNNCHLLISGLSSHWFIEDNILCNST